jgi:TPR repeat protein
MAAEQGYALSQLDLGYLYEQGKGVSLDYTAAYMWYRAAADRGEKNAELQLKKLSGLLTPDQVQRANAAAAKLTDSLPKFDLGNGLTAVGSLFPRH